MNYKKWKDNEINKAVDMINQGKNFKEIGLSLNKSQDSIKFLP